MSMKYLGEQIDIHTGGEDHLSVHHPNEIAQSEAATGKKPFVRYWVHHAFLMVDGRKMSKSLGNVYKIEEVESMGLDPLALRYLYLATHYRKPMNFTWPSVEAADVALGKLKRIMQGWEESRERVELSEDKLKKIDGLRLAFRDNLEDDLNTPQALAVVWQVVKSNIPDYDKYELIREFDEVLGLNLVGERKETEELPEEIKELVGKRDSLRGEKKWSEADEVRKMIEGKGYRVEDTPAGTRVEK